jgi:hypothetical protein
MQRSHTRSAARNHRARINMTFVTGLGLLLTAGTGFPSAGLAQSQPSPGTDSRGTAMPREGTPLADPQGRIPEAPVGHRQPRPQDLPPSVLRNEGGGANSGGVNADRPLKQELQICKGC